MSQNICALVDLFDKAVAKGARPNTVKKSLPTNKLMNEHFAKK